MGLWAFLGRGQGEKFFVPLVRSGRETFQEFMPWSPGPLPYRGLPSAPSHSFLRSSIPPLPHPTPPHLAPAPPLCQRGSKGGWSVKATVTRLLGAAGRVGLRKQRRAGNYREVIRGRGTGSKGGGNLAGESAGERKREGNRVGRALGGTRDCETLGPGADSRRLR